MKRDEQQISVYESVLRIREEVHHVIKTAKELVDQIDVLENNIYKLAGLAAHEDLARKAAEKAEAAKAAAPEESPPQVKSASREKYWDDKKGLWVDEKPVKFGADGNLEIDFYKR